MAAHDPVYSVGKEHAADSPTGPSNKGRVFYRRHYIA